MQELKLVKNLTFGDTARGQVLAGVEKLTSAVGSTLSAPSNADLTLTTSGSGKINISSAYTLPSSDGSANQVLQTNGSGVLSFADASGGGSGSLDGGTAASTYGGITAIDGGTAE